MIAFFGLTFLASLVGSQFSKRAPKRPWYRLLRKAPQNPPPWVFGVVWPALYSLIARSGARAWKKRDKAALALWGLQLASNAAWSPIFFGAHKSRLALADLALTGASAAAYTARVAPKDRWAALMMAPYLGWLAFAGKLNADIVRRNPRFLAG